MHVPSTSPLPFDQFTVRTAAQDLWAYIKKPTYIAVDSNLTVAQKIKYCRKIFLVKLLFVMIAIPIIVITQKLTGAEDPDLGSTWKAVVAVVVIAPVLEELAFRATLRYSHFTIALVIASLLGYLCYYFAETTLHKGLSIVVGLVGIPVIAVFLKPADAILYQFWVHFFPYIFHLLAISFGLMHLTNYDHINNYFMAIPLVSSQLLAGYAWGYVRMRFGLWYSIGLHIAWNFMCTIGLLVRLINEWV
jgi:membrane protease YdiL (CAAX protease family)